MNLLLGTFSLFHRRFIVIDSTFSDVCLASLCALGTALVVCHRFSALHSFEWLAAIVGRKFIEWVEGFGTFNQIYSRETDGEMSLIDGRTVRSTMTR